MTTVSGSGALGNSLLKKDYPVIDSEVCDHELRLEESVVEGWKLLSQGVSLVSPRQAQGGGFGHWLTDFFYLLQYNHVLKNRIDTEKREGLQEMHQRMKMELLTKQKLLCFCVLKSF